MIKQKKVTAVVSPGGKRFASIGAPSRDPVGRRLWIGRSKKSSDRHRQNGQTIRQGCRKLKVRTKQRKNHIEQLGGFLHSGHNAIASFHRFHDELVRQTMQRTAGTL